MFTLKLTMSGTAPIMDEFLFSSSLMPPALLLHHYLMHFSRADLLLSNTWGGQLARGSQLLPLFVSCFIWLGFHFHAMLIKVCERDVSSYRTRLIDTGEEMNHFPFLGLSPCPCWNDWSIKLNAVKLSRKYVKHLLIAPVSASDIILN